MEKIDSISLAQLVPTYDKNIVLDSALASHYAHYINGSPSAKIIQEYLSSLYALPVPESFTDYKLFQMHERMISKIIPSYKFDDPDIISKVFPAVLNRRTNGYNMVMTQDPKIIIDLGCGSGTFLMDMLLDKQNIDRSVKAIGLDFAENISIAKLFLDNIFPDFKSRMHLQTLDFTNARNANRMFRVLRGAIERTGAYGKLVFYSQGLFRYIPRAEQKSFVKIIYDIATHYPGEVVWVQADNEIRGAENISKLNNTSANIFDNVQDTLDIFTESGWKASFDDRIFLLSK